MTAVGRAAPRFAAGAACYALCSRGSLMGMHSLDLGGDPARLLRAPTRPSAIWNPDTIRCPDMAEVTSGVSSSQGRGAKMGKSHPDMLAGPSGEVEESPPRWAGGS